jgi:hypothetical protein
LKVAELKNKEIELKDTYDCGIDPKEFDEMNSKLPQEMMLRLWLLL